MAESLEAKSLSIERKKYSFEEAKKASTEYFKGDELAGATFVDKYALKDSFGNLYEKTPDDMHHRLANGIARIESKYPNPLSPDEIYGLLKDFKYIVPQGSPMTGIGNEYQIASLSNCFVIGNEENSSDSYGAIMKVDQEQVQLMKRRGGVGHDLSYIRPKGSPVKNSALTSTGVVPFMERYSNSTREVAQDGRRGALMLSLSIKHPDAEDFIDAKLEQGKVTGANVSVRIDDDFMKAVKENKNYIQKWPIDSENPKYVKEIDAKKLWDKIIHNAWKSAEPGILFWDTIQKESIPDVYSEFGYKTVSTNPCGEIPLCPYDSCRLLAVNLYNYVENPFTDKAKFNKELFKNHVGYAQRIMDDIIDLELEKVDKILDKINKDPESDEIKYTERKLWENIKYKAEEGRRTGVGITAEGDMLAALGLRYGSEEGNNFSEELHKTFAVEAYRSSVEMAKERGAFGIYNPQKEENNPFIQRIKEADLELYEEMVKKGRRNISLLTIAPTGTTSIMTQTTSGLEPVFLPVYKRKKKIDSNSKKNRDIKVAYVDEQGDEWEEFTVFHHKFVDWMLAKGYDVTKKYSDEELDEIVSKSPYYKATSNDVDWVKKVELQGRVQKYVDHSISVTVNLPNDISEEKVAEVYMKGWESGCKGITVYRDGSREGILKGTEKKKGNLEKELLENGEFKEALIKKINRPRPEYVGGMKEKIQTPHGHNAFVGVNWEKDENGNLIDPYEAFVEIARAGDDLAAIAQGYGRLISLALKAGVPSNMISNQLKGIGGNSQVGYGENLVQSLPDAIGKGMDRSVEKEQKIYAKLTGKEFSQEGGKKSKKSSGNLCNVCGGTMIPSEGCEKCMNCGNTRCG